MEDKKATAGSIIAIVLALICYTQLTIFIVPPIGAVPDGKTIVILRLNKTNFIDSADALCERTQGGVNLFCRGAMLAGVANNATILFRLPYIESLYLISTDGKTYSR